MSNYVAYTPCTVLLAATFLLVHSYKSLWNISGRGSCSEERQRARGSSDSFKVG